MLQLQVNHNDSYLYSDHESQPYFLEEQALMRDTFLIRHYQLQTIENLFKYIRYRMSQKLKH